MALLPHTLGHALLLQRLGNPFAGRLQGDPPPARVGDLVQALLVCTRPHSLAIRMIDTWIERPWMAVSSWRICRHGLERVRDELVAYLEASWPTINWWRTEGGRLRSSGAELIQVLIDRQRRNGLSLDEALGVPVAVASWDAAVEAERNGSISIRGSEDEAMLRIYDQMVSSGQLPLPGTVIQRN